MTVWVTAAIVMTAGVVATVVVLILKDRHD